MWVGSRETDIPNSRIVHFDAATYATCECADSCLAGNETLRFDLRDYALALSRARQAKERSPRISQRTQRLSVRRG